MLTSCNDDGYWEQAAPNQVSEVSFDQTSTKVSVPMADETTQFAVKLTRGNANGTVSIPVTIETATPEVLSGAENVEFADGQTTADYIINVTDAEPGITYTANIKLEDKYNTAANNITTTFSYNKQLEFTPMGTGYLIDGTVSAAFNLDNTLPYAVEIEFAKTSKATIYRFIYHGLMLTQRVKMMVMVISVMSITRMGTVTRKLIGSRSHVQELLLPWQ